MSLGSKDNQSLGSGTQRKRKPTSRYLKDNANGSLLPQSLDQSKITVVCNQTGKKMVVAASKLSNEMGELTRKDIYTPGTQLLLDENGRSYPVTVINQGTKKGATASKKHQQRNEDGYDDESEVSKKQQQRKCDSDDDEPGTRKKKQPRKCDSDDDEPGTTKKKQPRICDSDDDEPGTRKKKQPRKCDSDDDEPGTRKKKQPRICDSDDDEPGTRKKKQPRKCDSDDDEPGTRKKKQPRKCDSDDDDSIIQQRNDDSEHDEPMDETEEVPVKTKRDEFKENIMLLAKEEFSNSPHKQLHDRAHVLTANNFQCSKNDKPLDPFQREVLNRLTCIEKVLNKLLKTGPGQVTVKSEDEVDPYYMYNGVNLLKVVAKNPTAYARNLLDLMFTKKEQKQSLLLPTAKSSKPPLDQEKVAKLLDCLEKRYPKQYDMSKLLGSLNQKCRDAKPDIIID